MRAWWCLIESGGSLCRVHLPGPPHNAPTHTGVAGIVLLERPPESVHKQNNCQNKGKRADGSCGYARRDFPETRTVVRDAIIDYRYAVVAEKRGFRTALIVQKAFVSVPFYRRKYGVVAKRWHASLGNLEKSALVKASWSYFFCKGLAYLYGVVDEIFRLVGITRQAKYFAEVGFSLAKFLSTSFTDVVERLVIVKNIIIKHRYAAGSRRMHRTSGQTDDRSLRWPLGE